MKRLFFLFIFGILVTVTNAQIKAITGTGEEVVLYQDGTWKYVNNNAEAKEIKLSKEKFEKSKEATFEVKSTKVDATVFINPKLWSFKKDEADEKEYTFQHKLKDAYAVLITERIEIPLESLREIAIKNARQASPDVELIKEEYRIVNDKKLLCMQLQGSAEGIKFTYFGYYYSYAEGTIQFVGFTTQNLFKEYEKDLESLLNSVVFAK